MIKAKRIKMERVKMELGRRVRIWSGEWMAYWRPNAAGYVEKPKYAGEWTLREAYEMTSHCGPEKQIIFERI
jgi:hypothetical protein